MDRLANGRQVAGRNRTLIFGGDFTHFSRDRYLSTASFMLGIIVLLYILYLCPIYRIHIQYSLEKYANNTTISKSI